MDNSALVAITQLLKQTGPWGLVAILGAAYWRMMTRKEKEIHDLYDRLGELTKIQIRAIDDMNESLRDLCNMIGIAFLRSRGTFPPPTKKDPK